MLIEPAPIGGLAFRFGYAMKHSFSAAKYSMRLVLVSHFNALRVGGIAARGGRWLLSWACVLSLSRTIAVAAERPLAGSSGFSDAAQQVGQVPTLATASTSADTEVLLSSVDGAGKRLNVGCLTTHDHVSADVLAINPEDMAAVVANLCESPTKAVLQPGNPF